jgi:hypothetical protein
MAYNGVMKYGRVYCGKFELKRRQSARRYENISWKYLFLNEECTSKYILNALYRRPA